MPSIGQELAATRTARWYEDASRAHRAGAWTDRIKDYAALRAVLADNTEAQASATGWRQPPVDLPRLLKLVAERAHYAGAEPVYRRYRKEQRGQPITRWAGPDPAVRPTQAFLAEAKIAGFWPYREGVVLMADELDLTTLEWAFAYLRALAVWALDERPLAAYQPVSVPPCVPEDMAVFVASSGHQTGGPAAVTRLTELAREIIRAVLDDASMTPLGALNAVRDDVRQLLAPPAAPLADQALRAVAELSDRIIHADDGEAVLTPDQADQLQVMLHSLTSLLASATPPQRANGTGAPPGNRSSAPRGKRSGRDH